VAGSRERPHLAAVEDLPVEERAPARPPGSPAKRLLLGLAAALAVALLLLAVQIQRSGHLRAQVARLTGELAESRALVAAYQSRMDEVRRAVGDLSTSVEALQGLVREDPAPGKAPAPAPEAPPEVQP
jgi:hypothetical protein